MAAKKRKAPLPMGGDVADAYETVHGVSKQDLDKINNLLDLITTEEADTLQVVNIPHTAVHRNFNKESN